MRPRRALRIALFAHIAEAVVAPVGN